VAEAEVAGSAMVQQLSYFTVFIAEAEIQEKEYIFY